jgi:hypothetical protein
LSDAWTIYRHNETSIECSAASWMPLGDQKRQELNLPLVSSRAYSSRHSSPHLPHNIYSSPLPTLSTSSTLEQGTDGWFITECAIPEDAAKGRYHLQLLNIFDEFFNGVDMNPFWETYVYVTIY